MPRRQPVSTTRPQGGVKKAGAGGGGGRATARTTRASAAVAAASAPRPAGPRPGSKRGPRRDEAPELDTDPDAAVALKATTAAAAAAEAPAIFHAEEEKEGEALPAAPRLPPLTPAPHPVLPLDPTWFSAADPAKVAAVRAALLDDPPPPPPGCAPLCRADEAGRLDAAVDAALARPRGGVVWVTGRSGTGKSLTVRAVLERTGRVSARTAAAGGWAGWSCGGRAAAPPSTHAPLPAPAVVWVNCLELTSPGDAYARVADGLAAYAAVAAAIAAGGGSGGSKKAAASAARAAAWRAAHPILHACSDLRPPDRGEPADDALARARGALAALSAPGAGGGAIVVLDEADALDAGLDAGGGSGGAGAGAGAVPAAKRKASAIAAAASALAAPPGRALPPLRRLVDALTTNAPAGARAALVAVANTIDLGARVVGGGGGAADGAAPPPAARPPSSTAADGGPPAPAACSSTTIHFAPYDAPALAALLAARLARLPGAAFAPRGLDLLSRRVAGRCGDMRAAVGAAARALELAARDAGLGGGAGGSAAAAEAEMAALAPPSATATATTTAPGLPPRRPLVRAPSTLPPVQAAPSTAASGPVSMAHVAAAASAGAGADGGWDGAAGGGADAVAALRALPAQQQLVLVAALLAARDAATEFMKAAAEAQAAAGKSVSAAPAPATRPAPGASLFSGAVQRVPRVHRGGSGAQPLTSSAMPPRSALFSPAPVVPPRMRAAAVGVRVDDVAASYARLTARLGFPAESQAEVRSLIGALAATGLADLIVAGGGSGGHGGGGGKGGGGKAGVVKARAPAPKKSLFTDGGGKAGAGARLVPRVGLAAVRSALEGTRLAAACEEGSV